MTNKVIRLGMLAFLCKFIHIREIGNTNRHERHIKPMSALTFY